MHRNVSFHNVDNLLSFSARNQGQGTKNSYAQNKHAGLY